MYTLVAGQSLEKFRSETIVASLTEPFWGTIPVQHLLNKEMQPCAVFSLSLHCKQCFLLLTKSLFLICCLVSSPPPSKLDNSREVTSGGNEPHVHIEFCQYAGHMSSYVDYRECPAVSSSHEGHADICQLFAVSSNCLFQALN